jgi:hypothetical protein
MYENLFPNAEEDYKKENWGMTRWMRWNYKQHCWYVSFTTATISSVYFFFFPMTRFISLSYFLIHLANCPYGRSTRFKPARYSVTPTVPLIRYSMLSPTKLSRKHSPTRAVVAQRPADWPLEPDQCRSPTPVALHQCVRRLWVQRRLFAAEAARRRRQLHPYFTSKRRCLSDHPGCTAPATPGCAPARWHRGVAVWRPN